MARETQAGNARNVAEEQCQDLRRYHPTLANYRELLSSSQCLGYFRNSATAPPMKFWGSATLAKGIFLGAAPSARHLRFLKTTTLPA
jgi:hypothetical protein